jgi:hypothetical protein
VLFSGERGFHWYPIPKSSLISCCTTPCRNVSVLVLKFQRVTYII